MKEQRLDKTLGDYMAIAFSPLLIMGLVGSLTFFLLEITYEGQYAARLRWCLFWFVFAAVLVSRISIERGAGYAFMYGLFLAGVTGSLTYKFINSTTTVCIFLALIWWGASKLTWDCTLIDDEEDASGEGLLQVAGLDREGGESTQVASRVAWWRRLFRNRSEREGQPHSPGLWVVYFSIAALPVFGIGQLTIPEESVRLRLYGFVLLVLYVVCGLGLLMMTSFLGLRRYLRQRRLQMPARMAAGWVALGTALIVIIMLASVLLPRPNATYSLTALAAKIGSPERSGSNNSMFEDSAAEGLAKFGFGNQGGDQSSAGQGNRQAGSQKSPNQKPGAGGPAGSQSSSARTKTAGDYLRWILYALFAIGILWLIYRFRKVLIQSFKELMTSLINLLRALFGLRPLIPAAATVETASVIPAPKPRPFSSFRNPFAGKQTKKSPAELVHYSFEALQAWAYEYGWGRNSQQTPSEFTNYLGEQAPEVADDASQLSLLYGRLAYAGQEFTLQTEEPLRRLWESMTASRRK